ncbi:MAG TPA: hypothetical protein VFD01_14575 [Candidatus Dormibacteraeota bacterium]|jgi:hypothetical protein|nr:hypothetical protein [Candidatus Dormibacteraeota bacterium]
MDELSDEQLVDRLLTLENDGQFERRTQLEGERFLSLIQDPETGRGYVLQHGVDDTEGAEIPADSEVWQYDDLGQASAAYDQILAEARAAGEVVDEDSDEDLGDVETGGAELRDPYAGAYEDDPLMPGGEDDLTRP